MTDLLHPVGDGVGVGDITVVGGDVADRYPVLTPVFNDQHYVSIKALSGAVIDQRLQARAPIAFGQAVVRGRFAKLAGDGGIELAITVWGTDPRHVANPDQLIAQTRHFQVWQQEWTEYALQFAGRQTDLVAQYMGDLWIRAVVVSTVDGTVIPTIGVSAMWLEVPDAAEGIAFQDPTASPPPEDTLVTVRTSSGRSALAKQVQGEWFDESDQPFELDRTSLPLDANGRTQASRVVNGWGT